ncbi:hypothetical protein [Treponema phagedenis]|nr:hypothetical protein [Treponema phagedenis]
MRIRNFTTHVCCGEEFSGLNFRESRRSAYCTEESRWRIIGMFWYCVAAL